IAGRTALRRAGRWEDAPPSGRDTGYSLVELIVSLGLLMVVAAMGATLFLRATSFTTESLFRSDLMEAAKVTQERVFDQLVSARVISLAALNGQPAMTVVLPVELPVGVAVGGGPPGIDFFDAAGQINWGAVEPDGAKLDLPGDPHRLSVIFLPSGTVSEKSLDLDLNYDGDLADQFQLGSLAVKTTAGPEQGFVSSRLVGREIGKGDFDIDGDHVADPLFQVTGESWTDSNANGAHDPGETFEDSNKNEHWDG